MYLFWWPNPSQRREPVLVLLAVIVFLIGHSSPALAQSGAPGLVAAFGFDEGTGTTVKDSSGNNLNGTIVGATWTTTGMYGNALSFNGTSSYVDLGSPSALQLTGSMTIEAWVKVAANPADDGQIVSKSNGSGWQLKTSPDTGPHTFGISVSVNSTTKAQRYSTTVPALNTWYHIAGVYDDAALDPEYLRQWSSRQRDSQRNSSGFAAQPDCECKHRPPDWWFLFQWCDRRSANLQPRLGPG